jgi:hypothetical protein
MDKQERAVNEFLYSLVARLPEREEDGPELLDEYQARNEDARGPDAEDPDAGADE